MRYVSTRKIFQRSKTVNELNAGKKEINNSGIIVNSSPFNVNPLNTFIPWSETHRYINSLRGTKQCVYNHANAIKTFLSHSLSLSLSLHFYFHCIATTLFLLVVRRVVGYMFGNERHGIAWRIEKCLINKLARRMFAKQQTQDFCLFYLLSSKHYLFCCFFMYSYEFRAIIANTQKSEYDISKTWTKERKNCFPRHPHQKIFSYIFALLH